MWLSNEVFRQVVQATPLVAMDLLVRNANGDILLGERLNRPAQGWWFVPGGRVLKDEPLDTAFERLTLAELGWAFPRSAGRFLGVYEHFYGDSVFGDSQDQNAPLAAPSTHYVVLGYELRVESAFAADLPLSQHAGFKWWAPDALATSDAVHAHTKAYLAALV